MIGKKKSAEFRVPAPDELDSALAELMGKDADLRIEYSANAQEIRSLEKAIAASPEPDVSPTVAALLGDEPDAKAGMRKRLGEFRQRNRDIDAARDVLRKRIAEARSKASIAVTDHVKPEYAKRVRALTEALRGVQDAREKYQDMIDQFEALDVQWTRLGPLSLGFLGDRRDGHIPRFIRDAEGAGYV